MAIPQLKNIVSVAKNVRKNQRQLLCSDILSFWKSLGLKILSSPVLPVNSSEYDPIIKIFNVILYKINLSSFKIYQEESKISP